jgi:hypothetical protein
MPVAAAGGDSIARIGRSGCEQRSPYEFSGCGPRAELTPRGWPGHVLPYHWLVDATRAGSRCLQEGELPVFWRPNAGAPQPFVIFPADRSWRADFVLVRVNRR